MPDLNQAYGRIDEYVDRWMTQHNVPGLTMSITDRHETLRIFHYGFANAERMAPVDAETLFEIGSIGKSFTALCLIQLQEAGRIDLHHPVAEYLPWFLVPTGHEPITVHHLLAHTAGITRGGDYAPYGLYEAWALRNTTTGGPPCQRFHYSNIGYKVLGHLLEHVTGMDYADLIQSEILDPLGMSSTHAVITFDTRDLMAQGYWPRYDDRPAPPGNPVVPAGWHEYGSADGSPASNATDMAAYVRLFLNRGAGPPGAIISKTGFETMIQRYIDVGYLPDVSYGYGLNISKRDGFTHVDHGGMTLGYHATMMADLDNGIGTVILTNGTLEPTEVADFTLSVIRSASTDCQVLPVPNLDDPNLVENAGDFAGIYDSGHRRFSLMPQGDRLILTPNPPKEGVGLAS